MTVLLTGRPSPPLPAAAKPALRGEIQRTDARFLRARVAMALSKLSGDEQGIILGQLATPKLDLGT